MNKQAYILGIDQSTSGTKAIIINDQARLIGRETIEHKQIYPKPGWVEHDPEEIYRNSLEVMKKVISSTGISKESIGGISISNQRETVLAWNKKTGKAIYNAVVWQCMRGEAKCRQLEEAGHGKLIREKTGLLIDPYFSASGLAWILDHVEGARELAERGDLLAGTIDSWLVWKLTEGESHYTDHSNASRTLLFDIHQLEWSEEICELFHIPVQMLPKVQAANEIFGQSNAGGLFEKKIPISGILGDSHAALFGQRCFEKGLSKVTYGTGSSVMMNIGEKALAPPGGLVCSVGFSLKDQVHFVFEGNIHSTGATIKWMVDSLQLLPSSAESEILATSVDSSDGVYFVPAFSGLGAPYWNNQVRAAVLGMTGGTKKAHLVRAGLESIAYQVKDLLDLMVSDSGITIKEIRVDGGPSNNRFLMQFQSDMLNAPIKVSDVEEASALGAALAGGLGIGLWSSLEEIEQLYQSKAILSPSMHGKQRNTLYEGWKAAVKQLLK